MLSFKSGFPKGSLAPERNVWASEDDVNEALLLRGSIVSSFGQIETGLLELSLVLSKLAEYGELREKPPYGAQKTANFLKEAFDLQGPLFAFRQIGVAYIDRFLSFSELRNMMAHGRMQVLPDWGITFHFYQHGKGNFLIQQRRRLTPAQMRQVAEKIGRLARLGQRLYWRAKLNKLEHIE